MGLNAHNGLHLTKSIPSGKSLLCCCKVTVWMKNMDEVCIDRSNVIRICYLRVKAAYVDLESQHIQVNNNKKNTN